MFDTTRRRMLGALGLGGAASIAGCVSAPTNEEPTQANQNAGSPTSQEEAVELDIDRIAADPLDIPGPISRSTPTTHEIQLTTEEVSAEIEPGVSFDFMTFNGQIPGPMIRVRQGDTIELTLENLPESTAPHNVDFHAVYGTGGGAVATTAAPGEQNALKFKALYPGAYIYHCAVPNLDMHISKGMFGMILVEPPGGLPAVDHELYFGQHELYTDKEAGKDGKHTFNFGAMAREDPAYVLLSGEKYAWAAGRHGPIEVQQGDTVRVFLVVGGPNYSSNFHPIGNVWSRAYRDGGLPTDGDLAAYADKHIQTMKVPPGSCMIGEMETPVPSRIKLVDHALSRVVRKGMMAEIDVIGDEQPDIYDPGFAGSSHDDPLFG